MFGDRFTRSWELAKQSFSVLRTNPSLSIFPVLAGIAGLVVSIPFLGVLWAINADAGHRHSQLSSANYLVSAAMYFCNYFVIVFFNSALVACASEILQGRPATLGYGMRIAGSRLPQILGWALIASTFGMILRTIGERSGIVGSIVTSIIGLAWNLAVFFVVPCLVIDVQSPFEAMKTSTGMLKTTWGERIILGIGVGSAMGVLYLIAMVPFVGAVFLAVQEMYALAIVLGVVGVLSLLTVSVIGSAITTIYQTALYIYVRTGAVPGNFDAYTLQNAFMPKQDRKLF